MHEVIDYSKNFLTGMTKTVSKQKPDTQYTGVATIQIFDENKNIIQEVKSTNCITNAMLSRMYCGMFKDMLLNNRLSSLYESGSYSPAYWMLLTDNASLENTSEKCVKGNLIGYSDGWSAYSGDDTKRGTLNTAETINNEWSRHIVIDFPTNACNGTFKSIYWVPKIGDNFGTQYKADTKLIKLSSADYTTATLCVNNSYIYIGNVNNNNKLLLKYNISTKETAEIILDKSINRICCSEQNLYVLSSDNKIYKYSLEGQLLATCFGTTSASKITYYNGEIIIYEKDTQSLLFYNESGTKIRKYAINIGEVYSLYGDGDYIILLNTSTGTNLSKFKCNILSGEILTSKYRAYYENSSNSYRYYTSNLTKQGDYIYGVLDDNSSVYRYTECDYFSHTLLPEPITKMSANTMKIQYDFNVAPRGYFEV